MELEPGSLGHLRSLTGVAGGLLLHWAVLLVAPDHAASAAPCPSAPLVWMESSVAGGGTDSLPRAESAVAAAPSAARRLPVRRRRSVAPSTEVGAPPAPGAEGGATAAPESAVLPGSVAAPEASGALAPASAKADGGPGPSNAAAGVAPVAPHGPALLPAGSSCASDFPARARADHGEVHVLVDVDAGGHAHVSSVLLEHPHGQGFGSAARSCAEHLRFDPAIDPRGAPVPGHAKLRLRFDRLSSS